jgi:hypothetical protein
MSILVNMTAGIAPKPEERLILEEFQARSRKERAAALNASKTTEGIRSELARLGLAEMAAAFDPLAYEDEGGDGIELLIALVGIIAPSPGESAAPSIRLAMEQAKR